MYNASKAGKEPGDETMGESSTHFLFHANSTLYFSLYKQLALSKSPFSCCSGVPNPFYSTVPPILDNPTYLVENEDAENRDTENGSDEEPEDRNSETEKSEAEQV